MTLLECVDETHWLALLMRDWSVAADAPAVGPELAAAGAMGPAAG